MQYISNSIAKWAIKNNFIQEDDQELFNYGIKLFFRFIENILMALVIGICMGLLWESIVFSICYISLRRYAGGYHAKTPGKCFILSVILIVAVLSIIKYSAFTNIVPQFICVFIAAVTIFRWAPIESPNKPLSLMEKKAFQKKSRVILIIELVLYLVLVTTYKIIPLCIALAIICSGVMILISITLEKYSETFIKNK